MAVTTGTVANPLGTTLITDSAANLTAEANLFSGASTVYAVEIDNTANTGQTNYIKLRNGTSATPSSDQPLIMLYAPAGEKVSYMCFTGHAFGTGTSFWGTQTRANAAAQSAPSNDIIVKILGT